jgi:putative peptide zinc metalloprotease protein
MERNLLGAPDWEGVRVTVVERGFSVWEALAGRAPGRTVTPSDPGLWAAVTERINPARAKPRLRADVETAQLVSVRDVPYVMLRSPDPQGSCYLRLTPQERQLAQLMDGTRTVARLVAEFARISGRLAPDQVTRVVADLAANRMLEELPVDAFHSLDRVKRRPWPVRLGRGLLAVAKGQRLVVARVDPLIGFLYRAGGRLLFTRVAAVLLGLVAVAGLGAFAWTWATGSQSAFLTGGSYAVGAVVLLGLNVLALASHELGHALATKHAGRRVPAAGFLVYFGIPSVFVDTTDAWMAGRRARLVTTAAGPATGLVLAGTAQLVGLLYPPVAPWAFKLSFAWYLNVAFNLNPFIALDGYYLLMDWLEVPNLRARGLAWLVARLRRRPPRYADLDREGRLVALYGMLSLIWLVIAANLAYRIYLDRVGGLATGLWNGGWPRRLLLVAVLAGLAAPVLYMVAGWLGKRGTRLRQRLGQRSVAADTPRRYDALRTSALGRLRVDALAGLAADARWVRPRTGEQLVFAGAAQQSVYVVVDGALEGRRPGDPTGSVRERVGAGGVVGLAPAITGAPSALAWYTAGTTLLAIPSWSVAAAVGPLTGPHPVDRAELEHAFDHAPVLAQLNAEDRLGLSAAARPVSLLPGEPVTLRGADDALIVVSGVLAGTDGRELRAGALVGPFGVASTGPVAAARTPVRAWILPALGGLPLLLGRSAPDPVALGPGVAPAYGAHPPAGYPPLSAPPGEPVPVDDRKDRGFERKLWWLLILLLLFALLLTGSNLFSGPAWGEMPQDRALLHADRGTTVATVDGTPRTLRPGDNVYVGHGDRVSLADQSLARLTFRGGAYTVLCGGSRLGVGALSSPGNPARPAAALDLDTGRVLADTAGTSRAFRPATLSLGTDGAHITSVGPGGARFSVDAGGAVTVAAGTVTRDGTGLPATGGDLRCGSSSGGVIPAPDNGSPGAGVVPIPGPPLSPSASASASTGPSKSASASASAAPPASGPVTPTAAPTTAGPTTAGPTTPAATTSPPGPPRDTTAPVIRSINPVESGLVDPACGVGASTTPVYAYVSDPVDAEQTLTVKISWSTTGTVGNVALHYQSGDSWLTDQDVGPVTINHTGTLTINITVIAVDPAGNSSSMTTHIAQGTGCPIG